MHLMNHCFALTVVRLKEQNVDAIPLLKVYRGLKGMIYIQSYKFFLSFYKGNTCETMVCANEPSICKSKSFFKAEQCVNKNIAIFCPALCKLCTTTTPCIETKCNKEGYVFDKSTCKCRCILGDVCENPKCDKDPETCSSDLCSSSLFKYYCPITCGICEKLGIKPITPCPEVACPSGKIFNKQECKCTCAIGTVCDTIRCENEDPIGCDNNLCKIDSLKYYCPKTCNLC